MCLEGEEHLVAITTFPWAKIYAGILLALWNGLAAEGAYVVLARRGGHLDEPFTPASATPLVGLLEALKSQTHTATEAAVLVRCQRYRLLSDGAERRVPPGGVLRLHA